MLELESEENHPARGLSASQARSGRMGMIDQLQNHGIGTFWARGSLSALDVACLSSFVHHGLETTLFSYEPIGNLPAGVTARDASEILPQSMMARIRFAGKPDVTHFSDLFRFEMIRQTGLVWVDVDLMLIADVAVPDYENLIAKEQQGTVNGAILHIANPQLLDEVMALARCKLDRDLKWGETCVEVLSKSVRKMPAAVDLHSFAHFYPIDHNNIWRVFLPAERDYCEAQCASAATLHLFNNIVGKLGYWKDLAPPEGSYLHARLEELDLLGLFAATYPAGIMSAMVENWLRRQDGAALGIRSILRQAIPSLSRTFHHYHK